MNIVLKTTFLKKTHLVAASKLKSNISNENLDKNKKKLFLYFHTSYANQTNNFFSYILNINKNLKKTNEKKCCFNLV